MGIPIVVKPSGGIPVTIAANGRGTPMEIASNGFGIAVTVVASGGLPVTGFTTGPDVTAPIITSSNAFTTPENTAWSTYLLANEAVTWAKVGGADAAAFSLASGILSLITPANYEVKNSYVVQVQATDAASNVSTIQTITLTITDLAEDSVPNAFSFTDITGATISTLYTSNPVLITGYDLASPISVTGGAYDINGSGSFTTSSGTFPIGGTVRAQAMSSASYSTAVNCVVTIGGVSDTYSVTTGTAPAAGPGPVLDLTAASDSGTSTTDNITNVTSPIFSIDFTGTGAVNGDTLYVYDNAVQIASHALTAGEIAGGNISLGLGALTGGTHPITAKVTASGILSLVSNTVSLVIDVTGPTLSSPTGTQTGATTATLAVNTTEGTGQLWGVVTVNVTTPSATQVKAGQNAGGAPGNFAFGPQTVTGTTGQGAIATGLTASTTYYVHFVQDDAAGNTSAVATYATGFTTASGGSFDADTTAWENAVIAAGGTVQAGEKTAVNAFIVAEKTAATGDLWAKCQNMLVMCLNSPIAARVGVKKLTVSTYGGTGTPTHTPHSGIAGTTNSWLNFNMNPITETGGPWLLNSAAYTIVIESTRAVGDSDQIALSDDGSAATAQLIPFNSASSNLYDVNDYTFGQTTTPSLTARCLSTATRLSSTQMKLFIDGALRDTKTSTTVSVSGPMRLLNSFHGSKGCLDTMSLAWAGGGLTDAQAVEHQGHVNALIGAIVGGTHY